MKTLIQNPIANKAMAATIFAGVVVFVVLAVIHVIHLTEAGLINWNN